ncbi:MAG: hypothetical protein ACRC6E_10435 [Fusobacteriaceae bacterium]
MGIFRSVSRAISRATRSVSRTVRRVGREAENVGRRTARTVEGALRNPIVQGALVAGSALATGGASLAVAGGLGLGAAGLSSQMTAQKDAQKEAEKLAESEASKDAELENELKKQNSIAKAEREKEEKEARESVMGSYGDGSSALGNLGESADQTLGGSKEKMGAKRKKAV